VVHNFTARPAEEMPSDVEGPAHESFLFLRDRLQRFKVDRPVILHRASVSRVMDRAAFPGGKIEGPAACVGAISSSSLGFAGILRTREGAVICLS